MLSGLAHEKYPYLRLQINDLISQLHEQLTHQLRLLCSYETMSFLDVILPIVVDNKYGGHPLVPWILWLITLFSIWRSLTHWLKHDGGAQSIGQIPLDQGCIVYNFNIPSVFMQTYWGANSVFQFDKRATDFIIFMFAYWGVSQLVMCPVFIAILWRYNSLIPFMCLLIFSEWALRFYIARDNKFHTMYDSYQFCKPCHYIYGIFQPQQCVNFLWSDTPPRSICGLNVENLRSRPSELISELLRGSCLGPCHH